MQNNLYSSIILGGLEEGSSQIRKIYDIYGLSPTLQAAMGMGGGNVPLVIVENSDE